MPIVLLDQLEEASRRNALPAVTAYNRIDGPGSSLDLREFQQALWSMPEMPDDLSADPTMGWTRLLPRTVGITIDTGTMVEAQPFKRTALAIQSIDYGIEVEGTLGGISPIRENWLLKIMEIFGLVGVKFVLRNLRADTHSAGLGGSATATTAVCLLANKLAGEPLGSTQLISMASRMEQDLGVSITGTQEQSNVIYGGVVDYVWFPWGIPGRPGTGYGESLRTYLIRTDEFSELEERIAIFHTGRTRASRDVNLAWRKALSTNEGYQLHRQKPELAHDFREGIRLHEWDRVLHAIRRYREIRTTLCSEYMTGSEDIHSLADRVGGAIFPLGAGGGGGVLVFSDRPEVLSDLRTELTRAYRQIPFKIQASGHTSHNLPLNL